ncbi:ABC transporter ATP-binding protein [Faecalicatena contorta]|uniref:ABC-2 type transport system ATP-binding protein n=1 Tax=Faecalicatena contorta TaxID=39482 RepID=A0A315ZPJ5_9FIRM|nr:ABC transporter ATP-binding protein [Faecalicatena contorta]PWJ47555.1 ABC-2 type transport system ATP-binding protein [Faecalicatena contorta]SUQ15944.1 ABC-2 type transport system ATP-binding protein [Faecalicatena contorta]
MIEVKNLVKKYGNHLAIDNLSFKIEKGKIYGFLGPNGAGKSTTMNIMTGYLGATRGEVLINGHDILKEPREAKKHIGYLPELPPLYMEMTVLEYLDFAAELKEIPKEQRKSSVEDVLELVKLTDVRGRLIRNLSKGYRQRAGLAQAILGFPDIIILDEPTVGLDPKQIIEIRELIRKLAKDHTVILSSHILAEVKEVCDYIMIIAKGRLVASDTPDNLEHLMDDAKFIEIQAKAEPSRIKEILEPIQEISSVKMEEREDGTTFATLEIKENADIREKVFFAFAGQKCPLLLLNTNSVSLEEIFLELTQGDGESKLLLSKREGDETDAGDL